MIIDIRQYDNQTITDNLLPFVIDNVKGYHKGGTYLWTVLDRCKKIDLSYNTETGKASVKKIGTIAEFVHKEDIPAYTSFEEVIKWEFSGFIGSLFSCYMREGYLNW
jgi:hypothetical protein